MKRSVLLQGGGATWGVRRHPVDPGFNEGEMQSADRWIIEGLPRA
jgi:hypothetical protein